MLDKNIITRSFNPKTATQRLIEWSTKMTILDPLRVIANEQRAFGLAVKHSWFQRWGASCSFPEGHKQNERS